MPATILIIDDEVQLVRHLEHLLRTEGYRTFSVHTGAEAKRAVRNFYPDVVLVDLKLPDIEGTVLITELRKKHPHACYIVITAHGSIRSAVDATRIGAREYLTKPFEPEELLLAIRNAVREQLKEEELTVLRKVGSPLYQGSLQKESKNRPTEYLSETMRQTLTQAKQAASGDSIILLLGESGSGKDYLARYIHEQSRRANGPFFAINCAAVASELAESELFGHEPGAFTGARGRKRGLLELAENGTLLLNEVGELSMPIQAKLLTFLDTRSFTRVGGETQISVNARLIAATNRELEQDVASGKFRRDLFYRLNVITIKIPPLRDRIEDLPALIQEIVSHLASEMGATSSPELGSEQLRLLQAYDWPGNIRELRNVIERGLMLSDSGKFYLSMQSLDGHNHEWSFTAFFPTQGSIHDAVIQFKKALVGEALRRSNGSKQRAAELLGISRHALAHQLKIVGLDNGEVK